MKSLLDTLKTQIGAFLGLAPARPITVNIHYHRRDDDYAGWGLHVWGEAIEATTWEAPLYPTGRDAYGLFWTIKINTGTKQLGYVIHKQNEKDPGPDQYIQIGVKDGDIWLVQGKGTQFSNPDDALAALAVTITPAPQPAENQVLLHYRRTANDYDNWGLHVWGETTEETTWMAPLLPYGQDDDGIYWLVNVKPGVVGFNYLIHKGDLKDPGPNQWFNIANQGQTAYLIQGSSAQFSDAETAQEALWVAAIGDIKNTARAHWLRRDLIAWTTHTGDQAIYTFYHDPDGKLQLTKNGLVAEQKFELSWIDRQLPPDLAAQFPHLRDAQVLQVPERYIEQVSDILKGQYAITSHDSNGNILCATTLQIPGVLDDLYAKKARQVQPGIHWDGGAPTLRVWAPTAKSVCLRLFRDARSEKHDESLPMTFDLATGMWEITGQPSWNGQFYLYDVEVFVRQEGRFVHNHVTDPYSISLSTNSQRSQIINLHAPELKPSGWDRIIKPALEAPTDIIIYELHVREFSARDLSVPEHERGTYLAFTYSNTNGMQHLKALAQAGLTHIHLLPVFDFATVNEDKSTWKQVDFTALAQFPPDSEQQQAAVQIIRSIDGFNWGYDPLHYTTPEGSYATDPCGATRVYEFRQMIAALNQIGLRVVMDVVYNHTFAAGQSEQSVLDRVVPGYYHRQDSDGYVCNSTCCANTATEHAMMEKLMLDSLKIWATQYQIDAFRFDLMGHHMVSNMVAVRNMLDELTLETDGVDGKKIYIYGEGWDFGEVAGGARGLNATQHNLVGTGVGTFDDRLRDASRGGNPFGDITEQGYITGMYTDPNESDTWTITSRLHKLHELEDEIRVSLAGSLVEYWLVNRFGCLLRGDQISYRGGYSGYAKSPQEHIAYISAHDNETLFDAIQYKSPLRSSTYERTRMQKLGISLVLLSQGIPFLDSGVELLRSKSMDRDSYDSGDWFNHLDYTYQHNNWGVGLPLQDKNGYNWPAIRPRLANPNLAPTRDDILATRNHTLEMLQIRRSSPLFRLSTARDIFQRVQFFNTGPGNIPGLIVMTLDDHAPLPNLDPAYELIIVLFNAEDTPVSYTFHELRDASLILHPVLSESADPVVRSAKFTPGIRTFIIPGRTTAVFVGQGHVPPSPMLANYPIEQGKETL
jgi:pullulanase-type alpha-1,6-glucosidase